MKTDCCGCGCSGCLFWAVIFAALVLGSCGAVSAQSIVSKSVKKVEHNASTSVKHTPSSYSR